MIEFESVKVENFGSFLHVEFPVLHQGLVLILGRNLDTSGSNGAGKSLLAEALFFPIFDKLLRNVNPSSLVSLLSDKGDMTLELSFTFKGDKFFVKNSRKRDSRKNYEISCRGEKLPESPSMWWRRNVGYDGDIFSCLAVVSGGGFHPLIQGTDKNKKEYLTSLFDLQVYDKIYEVVKHKLNDFQSRCAAFSATLKTLETQELSILDKMLPDDEIISLQKHREELSKSLSELKNAYESLLSYVGKIEAQRQLIAHKEETFEKLKQLKIRLDELSTSLGDRVNKLEVGRKKIEDLSRECQSTAATLQLLTEQREKILSLRDKCPVCLQPISWMTKTSILEDINFRINKTKDLYDELLRKVSKGKFIIQQIEEFTLKKKLFEELQSQLPEVCELDESPDLECKVDHLRTQIFQIEKELSSIENTIEIQNVFRTQHIELVEKKNETTQVIKDIEDTILYFEFLERAFGQYGLKSIKLDNILTSLNQHISEYLSVLAPHGISAEYRPVEKRVTDSIELFVSDARGERPFNTWSSGERKRVQIAVLLSIWEVAQELSTHPPNFVFLDDCFGDLDDVGRDCMVDLLRSFSSEGKTVYVTSPFEFSRNRFDQVWYVEKCNGVSVLKI